MDSTTTVVDFQSGRERAEERRRDAASRAIATSMRDALRTAPLAGPVVNHASYGGETGPTADESCPHCRGAGWLMDRTDPLHPRDVMCSCLAASVEARGREALRLTSNLGKIAHLTFAAFDGGVPGVANALTAARRFAADPAGWLVLYGKTGLGKTHLAAAIANDLLGRDVPVVFQVVPALLDHFRSTFNPGSDVSYDDLFAAVKAARVLVLDDLGAESETSWARDKLFQLVDHRYIQRLPTVITTNLRLEDFKNARVADRVFDQGLSTAVAMVGRSYRQRSRGERKAGG